MRNFKQFLVIVLSLFSLSSFGAGGKLIDMLLNETGVLEILAKKGIDGVPAEKVGIYVKNALSGLSYNGKTPSKSTLKRVLNGISGTSDDIKYRKELLELLEQDADKMLKGDLVKAVNNLIFLSNRYGINSSTVLACAKCVSETLAKNGFKFTYEIVSDKSVLEALESMVPKKATDVKRFLKSKFRERGFGSLPRSRKLLDPSEERSLGLFTAMADPKSPATKVQRAYIDAVVEFSTDSSGKVNLIDADNPHLFWKAFESDMDPKIMSEWTALIKDANVASKESSGKWDAFITQLRKRAGKDEVLQEHVNMIDVKGCFKRAL